MGEGKADKLKRMRALLAEAGGSNDNGQHPPQIPALKAARATGSEHWADPTAEELRAKVLLKLSAYPEEMRIAFWMRVQDIFAIPDIDFIEHEQLRIILFRFDDLMASSPDVTIVKRG